MDFTEIKFYISRRKCFIFKKKKRNFDKKYFLEVNKARRLFFHFSVKDLFNFSKNSKDKGPT